MYPHGGTAFEDTTPDCSAYVRALVLVQLIHALPGVQVPIYPPQQTLADFTPDMCRQVVRQSLGLPDIPIRLGTVRQWTMSSQVADRFQVSYVQSS